MGAKELYGFFKVYRKLHFLRYCCVSSELDFSDILQFLNKRIGNS